MAEMKPFADDDASVTVGGLTAENGADRVSLSGSLDIVRDRQGLDHARALQGLMAAVVAALEAEPDLPDRAAVPKTAPTSRKPNPFA